LVQATHSEAQELLEKVRARLLALTATRPTHTRMHSAEVVVGRRKLTGDKLPPCPSEHPACVPHKWISDAWGTGTSRRRHASWLIQGWDVFDYEAFEDDGNTYGSTSRHVKRSLFLATDGMVLSKNLVAIRHASELRLEDVPPAREGTSVGFPVYGTDSERQQYWDDQEKQKADGQLAVLRRELSRNY